MTTDLRNDEIKSALIADAKARTAITSEVDADEIREWQWQGTEFSYPNIRLRILQNSPDAINCHLNNIRLSWMIFSEEDSSQQVDRIAGIINKQYNEKPFISQTINFTLRTTDIIPAIRSDRNTWRAEVLQTGMISGTPPG